MFNPVSTYRIQFHKGFTFKDFKEAIPYLADLGVSTIYASPILEAVPGSMHGYDTINPERINPEIGTLQELKAIAKQLKKLNISWIQDIVPNHMAFDPGNLWLMDVLEKGSESKYAAFFDINWSGDNNLPLMVPFLGSSLEDTIANGELQLIDKEGKFYLKYFDTEWPVNSQITDLNAPLNEVVDKQYYRLCNWEETDYQINYRRFFTVNGLICLNMQREETFTAYHKFISSLVQQDIFQGLRVDHIDGLYDPEGYLNQLRELAGENTYIVIEKILEEGESIPPLWPIEGTTGYEFLADANNLFTDQHAKKELTRFYERLVNDHTEIPDQITNKKTAILEDHMAGELNNLGDLFLELELATDEEISILPSGSLKKAIAAFLIHCPVYRYYGNELPLQGKNKEGIKGLFKKISGIKDIEQAAALLEKIILDKPEDGNESYLTRAGQFYLRCMQFSGPLMAKGVEDTLMYTYNRFVGHNEVGDSPEAFGISKADFHEKMAERQYHWPMSLNGTSTHDTKRGEDVRARLNVLSDIPEEWIKTVNQWRILNSALPDVPDANDEYFVYQTLIGSYPMPGAADDDYAQRLNDYLEKALREGKMNSSWADPDVNYEEVLKNFAGRLMDKTGLFWESFSDLHSRVADFGIINSLSQLLLKYTAPGVPDVYQGTELWDLSLVDPDNRRPVDYQLRKNWLANIEDLPIIELWNGRYDGKIKLWLQHALLIHRKENSDLFNKGTYLPLEVKGRHAKHVFAFARRYKHYWTIVALPLNLAGVVKDIEELELDWKDTRIIIPAEAPLEWTHVINGEDGQIVDGELLISSIFKELPLALLHLQLPVNERGAGVLMHITSLPSEYGIGDMGQTSSRFIEFLAHSRQKYWQLLPLNPIVESQSWSPYSSISSFAGNTLLISPDLLAADGLLDHKYLKRKQVRSKGEVDYIKVVELKNEILDEAYANFSKYPTGVLQKAFTNFCEAESGWLDNFVLYVVLKQYHQDMPWFEWSKPYKARDEKALKKFAEAHEPVLLKIKWQQFIFFRQWARLKALAAVNGIQLYGDLPFYAGLDSADTWANPEFFSIDKNGSLTGIAGVPPDYFNADGQLWGMPVYQWGVLKESGYDWWLKRIRKNMELYDLLRLDHFRAFYDYWEVPAGAENAINGSWKSGPGLDFFEVLKNEFPDMPFIAEDLGEMKAEVFLLRDAFNLSGMKVLQFAFGKDMAESEHVPHCFASTNFVAYTGTHDNNTSVGWYENDADKIEKHHLQNYAGHDINKKNVHKTLSRLAFSSIARIVILPVQDILGLDEEARMNVPASIKRNWKWRLRPRQLGQQEEIQLRLWTETYGRV